MPWGEESNLADTLGAERIDIRSSPLKDVQPRTATGEVYRPEAALADLNDHELNLLNFRCGRVPANVGAGVQPMPESIL
jgi:hypothetical protein